MRLREFLQASELRDSDPPRHQERNSPGESGILLGDAEIPVA